jgi:hypothetical protein
VAESSRSAFCDAAESAGPFAYDAIACPRRPSSHGSLQTRQCPGSVLVCQSLNQGLFRSCSRSQCPDPACTSNQGNICPLASLRGFGKTLTATKCLPLFHIVLKRPVIIPGTFRCNEDCPFRTFRLMRRFCSSCFRFCHFSTRAPGDVRPYIPSAAPLQQKHP